jgi:hypothetical protein
MARAHVLFQSGLANVKRGKRGALSSERGRPLTQTVKEIEFYFCAGT